MFFQLSAKFLSNFGVSPSELRVQQCIEVTVHFTPRIRHHSSVGVWYNGKKHQQKNQQCLLSVCLYVPQSCLNAKNLGQNLLHECLYNSRLEHRLIKADLRGCVFFLNGETIVTTPSDKNETSETECLFRI